MPMAACQWRHANGFLMLAGPLQRVRGLDSLTRTNNVQRPVSALASGPVQVGLLACGPAPPDRNTLDARNPGNAAVPGSRNPQ